MPLRVCSVPKCMALFDAPCSSDEWTCPACRNAAPKSAKMRPLLTPGEEKMLARLQKKYPGTRRTAR